jgi:uroporphyrin-III C-methyltransferase
VAVVSRAGWPDQHGSDHRVDTLPEAVVLHGGRPTVVIVGVGASAVACLPVASGQAIALPVLPAAHKP